MELLIVIIFAASLCVSIGAMIANIREMNKRTKELEKMIEDIDKILNTH